MPFVRPVVIALCLAVTMAASFVLSGATAHARPENLPSTIAQVTKLLDRLSRQNDMLDERYNGAVAAVAKQQKVADRTARQARTAAAASVDAANRLKVAAVQQYEAGPSDSTGMLLTSENPQAYLDNLGAMDYLSAQFATLATRAVVTEKSSRAAAQQARVALTRVQAKLRAVHAQRVELVAKTVHFKKVLAALTAQQRREYARARAVAKAKAEAIARAQARARARAAAAQANSNPAPAPSQPAPTQPTQPAPPAPTQPAPASGGVQKVIAYAEAQVGKAYSFAAAGPNSFDCSGLTMMAWAQAGVQLPHQASAQYNVGQHVSYDQLQPGDLIFLYQPIGHVEIYVGNDLAVSAADPALGIVYVHPSSDMADYVGATRP
ncbi:MAG TPA: NlpC/P60 family protein [Jatrophihabitans sp.]